MGGITNGGRGIPKANCRAALALMALTVMVLIGATGRAQGELTVEALAAPSVSGVGPYYQDLEDAIKSFAGGDYNAAYERLQMPENRRRVWRPPRS